MGKKGGYKVGWMIAEKLQVELGRWNFLPKGFSCFLSNFPVRFESCVDRECQKGRSMI